MASHLPASRVWTLFATATWVCRSGSPARESRWVNATATSPRVSTCRTPPVPSRVNSADRSRNASASETAAWCAFSIAPATGRSATAHSVLTDFTGDTGSGEGGLWTALPSYQWTQDPAGTAVAYLTPALGRDTAVIGAGRVDLWVRSSTPNVDLCKSLGADEVIDYKKGSVLEALKKMEPFDHVVDNVGSSQELYFKAHEYTKPSAIFLCVAGAPNLDYMLFSIRGKLFPSFLGGGKRKFATIFAETKTEQLKQIGDWMAEGKVKAVIDSKFPFEEAPEAFRKQKTGRAKGKIVVEGPVESKSS